MVKKENNPWYLVKFFLTTLFIFVCAKVVFILCNAPSTSFTDILSVLRHGLSLDFSTSLYFLILPFFAVLVSVWLPGASKPAVGSSLSIAPSRPSTPRWLRVVLRCYYVLISVAFALAFVADTNLYSFWAFKLDASCLQYLSQPEGITASVSPLYLLVRFVLILVFVLLFYLLYSLSPSFPVSRSAVCSVSRAKCAARSALKTLAYLALVPLFVIGIRGGLSESTTNIGQVYFSENQFLNHAAVNPVFSFLSSLSHQVGDVSQYHFMSDAEALRLTAGVYTTASCPVGFSNAAAPLAVSSPPAPSSSASSFDGDSLAGPLLSTSTPSIVIILMESAGEQFASVMPRLQRLKREAVTFTRCYANSWRTDRGTLSLLSGYPSFPTISVMKMPHKSRTLPSIAATLRQRGYRTHYLYGGDINFTNMRSYLLSTGWQTLTCQDDYTAQERATAQWGVRDDITFRTLLRLVTAETPVPVASLTAASSSLTDASASPSSPSPLLVGFSTLSSHEPWDVPLRRHADPVLNAFAYLDDCLGSFIDSLKSTPQWRDLLVLVTADHGILHGSVGNNTPEQKNHIPMLWLGGAITAPRTIDTLCNQSDLAATLLAALGLPHDAFTFSRDVLSPSYTHPTAVNNYNNAQWLLDASGHLLYDLDAHRVTLFAPSSSASFVPSSSPTSPAPSPDGGTAAVACADTLCQSRLLRLSQAILQLTTTDLSNR